MESNGTWKERNQRQPYYKILHQDNAAANVQANWHGVPAATDNVIVSLSPAFLEQYVIPPYAARAIITSKDELSGKPACNWVAGYAALHHLELQLYRSFNCGYHILHVSGPSADNVPDALLATLPLNFNGWYAAVVSQFQLWVSHPTCFWALC